ncbi:MAG TPA: sulfotransferase, partial [Dehalococcoidia bacterium]|nr:sulfotransferase [Dehalococcoidia bacterium]
MPVCDLNEEILFAVGMGEWHRWASRAEILEAARPFVPRMRELIDEACRDPDGPRGWKDPRFSWTIEAWLPQFPEKPRLVVCLRSPGEVVDSTMRVYGLASSEAREAADEIWPNYYRRLLELIDDLRLEAYCVEYERLLSEPEAAVAGLADFVGHPLDHRWVEPQLRRFAAPVPERYRDLYERVRGLNRR